MAKKKPPLPAVGFLGLPLDLGIHFEEFKIDMPQLEIQKFEIHPIEIAGIGDADMVVSNAGK